MNEVEVFENNGYVGIKNFVDNQTISVVSLYLENKIKRNEWVAQGEYGDRTTKLAYYADPLIEVLLLNSRQAVEEIIGKELLPTYSYARIYQPGESLKPHVDRPSCEVSVTINVAYKGTPSPIYTQYKQNDPIKHVLSPGDALIYKGCEVMHWRQPLTENQLVVQFMLHYVSKYGPNSHHVKDGREGYGYNTNRGDKDAYRCT